MTDLVVEAAIAPTIEGQRAVDALAQRLSVAWEALTGSGVVVAGRDSAVVAADTLSALVDRLRAEPRADEMWLVYAAVSTVFPSEDSVRAALRHIETDADPAAVVTWLLETCLHAARSLGTPTLEMDIVTSGVVVDVDFSAQHEHNTGIQRVVRNTVPRWNNDHEITMVAWLERDSAMRRLSAGEIDRVIDWSNPLRHGRAYEPEAPRLLVPWKSAVILSEVPSSAFVADAIAAIGSVSGNHLGAIGYDAIPTVSADMVPWDMADHFARYLTIVKSMSRLAGISSSAAAEFQGFVDMIAAQGLRGPRVVEVELPGDVPERREKPRLSERPVVLVVGSKEPRKNHVSVLFAAERLWREGLEFDLEMIGTYGWSTVDFRRWYRRLKAAGRPINAPMRVGDQELWEAYETATVMIFPSLHEGYGLPVAEALAHGTPVITSNYGSTAEVARHGGCILVDPRDDEQIVDALRSVLTDPELRARLSAEAAAVPVRTWQQYADELWQALAVYDDGAES